MDDLTDILYQYEPITLKEMDSVKLMNRTDRKFVLPFTSLPAVLQYLKSDYRVLEVADKRISYYRSLYYDDDSLSFYHQHHSGWNNRVKIRHRTYVDSNLGFLEVKLKTNKGRTIKNRIQNEPVPESINGNLRSFVESKVDVAALSLKPVIWINYHRITLVSLKSQERLTIDTNLEFIRGCEKKAYPNLVIVEVKQDRKQASRFFELARTAHFRQGSLSKYCMAIALTSNHVKQNNFKHKLRTISHLLT